MPRVDPVFAGFPVERSLAELESLHGGQLDGSRGGERLITAYLIIGHPKSDEPDIEGSMHFANSLGIRLMLSEFSLIPGTPDGELCRPWIDLDEPLWHNKRCSS